jgi:hypothetical protein
VIPALLYAQFSVVGINDAGYQFAKHLSLEMRGPTGEALVWDVVSVSAKICHWVRASALVSQLH